MICSLLQKLQYFFAGTHRCTDTQTNGRTDTQMHTFLPPLYHLGKFFDFFLHKPAKFLAFHWVKDEFLFYNEHIWCSVAMPWDFCVSFTMLNFNTIWQGVVTWFHTYRITLSVFHVSYCWNSWPNCEGKFYRFEVQVICCEILWTCTPCCKLTTRISINIYSTTPAPVQIFQVWVTLGNALHILSTHTEANLTSVSLEKAD